MKIYLAGPISGLSYSASEQWRDEFKRLVPSSIACYSPLRSKRFLERESTIEQSYEASPLTTDRGIMTRDHLDCSTADLIVCNLLGVWRVSVGTVMECAWAFAYRKPLVLIMESGSVHDHPMIREAAGFRVADVPQAASVALSILRP